MRKNRRSTALFCALILIGMMECNRVQTEVSESVTAHTANMKRTAVSDNGTAERETAMPLTVSDRAPFTSEMQTPYTELSTAAWTSSGSHYVTEITHPLPQTSPQTANGTKPFTVQTSAVIKRTGAIQTTVTAAVIAAEPTTVSPATDSPATAPSIAGTVAPIPTEPEPLQPPTPAFNIDDWVCYARNYAQSVGLRLDDSATDCWDNPSIADSHAKTLERNIQSRLNRYARDEAVTDVWIWAEKRSDGSYELFIGYA